MPSASATMPSPTTAAYLFRPQRDARVLWVLGTRLRLLVNGSDTGGRYSIQENYVPAFTPGPPLHAHDDAEELFHIIDGALKFQVGEASVVARPGDSVIVPRGTLHTFSNPFLTACRSLVQLTPAGFERFFEEVGVAPVSATDLLTPPTIPPPSPQQLRAAAIKYRMRVPGLTD
jgi:mannose-6-phosphate isomerase-like protein (cupin superfamily)